MLPSLLLLAAAPLAAAHTGCGGHEIARRNPGGPVIHRRQVDNTNVDPVAECAPYTYAPVNTIKAQFPAIWQAATLVQGDSEAAALFATINATVNQRLPNDLPRGTANGNMAGVNYDNADPDCWWTWKQCTTPAASTGILPDITTMPEPETWGFGFDDGPNCSHNALYNFLAENNQKATMFFIGSNVMDWPVQAIRAKDDGHQICVHTWSHQYMTSFSNEQAFAELYYTRKAIKDVIGVTPKCWRPPFGDTDNRIRLIASLLNMTTVVWSDDTDDWKVGIGNVTAQDVDNNYLKVINAQKAGAYATHGPVVLNHEINNYTMGELIKQYPAIKAAFKYIVPIATGLNISNPYEETNITFPTFAQYTGVGNTTTSSSASAGASASGSASAVSGSASASSSSSAVAKKNASGALAVSSVSAASLFLGLTAALLL
ncbi:Chitin deacetylase [Vanrija pseudolonga]|uniref:chitin deacetylase n=1 Tax=Vanrija pseudolonga TaxID=143232 RepID=A0AAF1BN67_9TREE|nr:Chitin deacetylase [Vanrija pseudolonga]